MHGDRPALIPYVVLILAACASCVAAQDDCLSALPIGTGLTAGNTNALSTGSSTACGISHKDAWFLWVATCNGTASADLCGLGFATFDTILVAYDGAAGCGQLVALACNDNACGTRSTISFSVAAGAPYYITVGGKLGASGSFTLSLSCSSAVPHDECGGAFVIGNGLTSGANLGATNSPQSTQCGNMGSDVWYAYTAPCTGVAEATFCAPGSASFDTVLAVFAAAVPCSASSPIACNDDTCGLRSKASFPVTAGSTYYLEIGGFGGAQGTFMLSLACHPAPQNDDCSGASPLLSSTNGPFSNQFATNGQPTASSCSGGFGDVWFSWSPACAGRYRIDTCGTGYDTMLWVYDGCIPAGQELACNDNDPLGACATGSAVEIQAAAATTYYIRVAGTSATAGSFNITVTQRLILTYSAPAGPGTIAFTLDGGPANGVYLDVVTFNQGAFPNGAFYGVDVTVDEVLALIALGYPFFGPLDGCGATAVPLVFAPFLSGVTLYSVAVASDPSFTLPIVNSPPVSFTVP